MHKVQTLHFPVFALVAYINFPDKQGFFLGCLLFQLPSILKRHAVLTPFTEPARLTQLSVWSRHYPFSPLHTKSEHQSLKLCSRRITDPRNSFSFMWRTKGGRMCARQLRKGEEETSVIICDTVIAALSL